ncbi:PX-SNARE domain protein (macronuclear) [Tetrahymena thermophila SB210]|uniref:PX-SNARE domain protein n=1 Tax=Tetrahymena thermophila (strain SB210) TaxID=312017 RepID=Q23AC3_TETTS|nr:PX-SNARE domain protein [Tetrahymena thermophila SB210]EAR93569.2 PX-SNARE domain protein [Tetrahymena thermophila SB210]|eukprot:XP_001013814.2 PX-SNARE domain protein [Tetrahymena thermophila SB210]
MNNTLTAITASIIEWKFSEIDNTKIIYIIEVEKRGQNKWTLKKRYKEFDELNKNLKKLYANLPPIPGKTLFAVKDPAELEKRKQGLDNYLKQLIARPDVYHSDSMKQFLELDQHASDQIINPPRQLGELTGFVHGVRDFFYDPDQGVLFVLCGDMNVASRVDAYLTNMKMPWEKEQPQTLLSVGTLECWLQNNQGGLDFEKAWSIPYPLQAICMHWEPSSCILSVGLDEGRVNQIRVNKEIAYTRYENLMEYNPHEQRIMGIYYDNITDILYTCSEDKFVKTIENKECTNVIRHSDTGLTGMIGDKEYKRLFVTNRSGVVYIYSISSSAPELLSQVYTQQQGVIRGLALDTVKNYIITGGFDDGEIAVIDIEKPGREKYAKLSASFVGKKKVRSVSWSGSRGEIYVGTQDGTITIWNAKKGVAIYVMKGHQNEITKVQWIENKGGILLTSAKEKFIKFWAMPKEWRDKHIEQEEEDNVYKLTKDQKVQQIKEKLGKAEIDSDEDDLQGWHKY